MVPVGLVEPEASKVTGFPTVPAGMGASTAVGAMSWAMATSIGATDMGKLETAWVVVLMTLTVSSDTLVTNARALLGVKATFDGCEPTAYGPVTTFDPVARTLTELPR